MSSSIGLYIMAGLYVIAGIMHFIKPKLYWRIIPPYFPNPKALVVWSGIAEIALGLGLLIPASKNLSIYGIIAMLLLFLSVHFHMLKDKKAASGLPKWALILRIPLQFGLIYWAWVHL